MQLLNRVLSLFFSNKLTGILLFIFAIAMATGTFIENDFGTETSKALVYSAKWFEIVMVLLAINFLGNIAKYNLFSIPKAPIFLLHLSLIIIIIGAGVTKYRGYEALVTIKEKEQIDKIVSIDSFLQLNASNHYFTKNFNPKLLLMSELGLNYINESYTFENQKIKIKLKKYIPRAQYILEDSNSGYDYLHLVIANDSQRKDFYLKKGTRDEFYGVGIAFESQEKLSSDIQLLKINNQYQVIFPETTNYFSMIENKAGTYIKDSITPIKFKALTKINNVPLVFNTIANNKIRKLIQKPENKEIKNPESAIVLSVQSGNKEKEIVLLGGRGFMNPSTKLTINNIQLKLRYGSRPINLPFSLYLTDFNLEKYPGSDSPSSFHSDLEIRDGDLNSKHSIFMNNVLDYKGFRFFQSAYLPDESGTILSVNHDKWGTIVTYIGYILLALGMVLNLLWKTRLFQFIKNIG